MVTNAIDAPKRFQFEASSGSLDFSQRYNCGATCAAFVCGYYRGTKPGIEAMRTNAGIPRGRSTYYSEIERMCDVGGVPSTLTSITSMQQLTNIVGGGRRPVILALYMARVPYSVRGHGFTGWHAVTVLDDGYRNGIYGYWVNDPNFSAPGGVRPDPTGGKRFYSWAVLNYAFMQNTQHWAIVPNAPKYIAPATSYVTFNVGAFVSLRLGTDARVNGAWAVANYAKNEIRQVSNGAWIGHATARRTLYGVVNGYRVDGTRQTYNKLRLAGTGRYTYVDSRFMHRV